MNEKLYTEDFEDSENVLKHLRRADYLLIFLPVILAASVLVGVPVYWMVDGHLSGNPTTVGGFDFGGLVIFAGIILWLIFCGVYGLLAFMLSVSTTRNSTFRIRLAVGLLSIVILFFVFLSAV